MAVQEGRHGVHVDAEARQVGGGREGAHLACLGQEGRGGGGMCVCGGGGGVRLEAAVKVPTCM